MLNHTNRAWQEFGERLQQVDDPDLARERASAIKATRRLLRALSNVNRSRSDGENTRLRGAPSNLTGSECGKPDRAGSEQVSLPKTCTCLPPVHPVQCAISLHTLMIAAIATQ